MNYLEPLVGGAILGISSLLLLAATGRIAGISGILGNVFKRQDGNSWRWMFLLGLMVGPLLVNPIGFSLPEIEGSWWMMIVGGLLVGFGSTYGSGCTSGHGICGIGRFSGRSITSVMIFMVTAALTVFVIRHLIGVV